MISTEKMRDIIELIEASQDFVSFLRKFVPGEVKISGSDIGCTAFKERMERLEKATRRF